MPSLAGFAGGAYESQSRIAAGEHLINKFPEVVPQGNKARSVLYDCPGLATFATGNDAPGRGAFAHDGRFFAVLGRTLYESDLAGVLTNRGTVATDANPVTFDTNGDGGAQLFITSGGVGYMLNLTTNALTTPLASGANMGGQLDGFFISLNTATSTMRISELLDGATWTATQTAQRTSASDPWISMIVARGEICLLGNKTGEFWYNAGLSPFPFAERPEGVFQVGIAAAYSIAKFAGTFAWLGRTERGNPAVYEMDGYTPVKISTPAVEALIQQYDDAVGVEDAIGWGYDRNGHLFYVLTFPTSDRTWTYDWTTRKWHQRGYWSTDAADFIEYRPLFHAHCFNRNLVLDSDGFRIYSLSDTTYTDVGGVELRRVRRGPHLAAQNKRLFIHAIELEAERGVGQTSGQGVDPQVGLRLSRDGGFTWGVSRMRSMGAMGAYGTRIRWEHCGSGRDVVPEVWTTDPAPSRWLDLYYEATLGRH